MRIESRVALSLHGVLTMVFLWAVAGISAVPAAGDELSDRQVAEQESDQTEGDAGGTEDPSREPKKREPRFIPIPVFITEPAIGYGFGGALVFFHERDEAVGENGARLAPGLTAGTVDEVGRRQRRPPNMTGIAAAYTDRKSWGVGGGHFASWCDDTVRYSGVLGYANLNSTFYFLNIPFDFNLEGGVVSQDLKFRVGASDFWLGGKLSYLAATADFSVDQQYSVELLKQDVQDFGIAFEARYEGRDNLMTPNRGQLVELIVWKYSESLGGDYDYWKTGARVLSFHPFAERFVLGLRFDVDAVDGRPPVWGYPWISLRGVPGLRYQNEYAVAIETELRWNIREKWAAIGFVGTGATGGDVPLFRNERGVVAGGVGARYLFRPQDNLWVGTDVAKGPEDWVFYIQVGHAW